MWGALSFIYVVGGLIFGSLLVSAVRYRLTGKRPWQAVLVGALFYLFWPVIIVVGPIIYGAYEIAGWLLRNEPLPEPPSYDDYGDTGIL